MSKDDSGKGSKIVRQTGKQEQLREQSEDQLQTQPEQTISIKHEEEEEDEASLVTTDIVVRSFIKTICAHDYHYYLENDNYNLIKIIKIIIRFLTVICSKWEVSMKFTARIASECWIRAALSP